MAGKVECLAGSKTFEAENDLSDKQYYLVVPGTDHGEVDISDADTDIPLGVLQDEPEAGESAAVRMLNDIGTATMIASDAITRGALVVAALVATAGDRGKIRTLTGITSETVYIVGRALEAATADGDEIEVQLMNAIQRVIA